MEIQRRIETKSITFYLKVKISDNFFSYIYYNYLDQIKFPIKQGYYNFLTFDKRE